MSNEALKKGKALRFLLFIVATILPRGIRDDALPDIERVCQPAGGWLSQVVYTVAAGYHNQVIRSFDKVAIVLQVAGVGYIFSAVSLPAALGVVLGATLSTLILRSAFTYPFDRYGKLRARVSPWLDSLADAAITMVVVLASEALTEMISPDLHSQHDLFLRGTIVGVPMLGAMRQALRPRFVQKMPFQGSTLTSLQIFWRTWGLSLLWLFACQCTIISNSESLPDWIPGHQQLQTFIPMSIFIIWFRIQQNSFARRNHIETAFTDWQKIRKARLREVLFKGMDKGEPLYWVYVALQGLLFLYLAIPLATSLWPWLAGRPTDGDLLRVAVNALTLAMLAWTWNYVKDANRAAADALQRDIDGPDFAWYAAA